MKNNGTSKIIGQGDVHVVTNTSYKLRFKNVRNISDLRMNLLSKGVLDGDSYTSYFAERMCKLGGSLVITKRKKYFSLYKTRTSLV